MLLCSRPEAARDRYEAVEVKELLLHLANCHVKWWHVLDEVFIRKSHSPQRWEGRTIHTLG